MKFATHAFCKHSRGSVGHFRLCISFHVCRIFACSFFGMICSIVRVGRRRRSRQSSPYYGFKLRGRVALSFPVGAKDSHNKKKYNPLTIRRQAQRKPFQLIVFVITADVLQAFNNNYYTTPLRSSLQ